MAAGDFDYDRLGGGYALARRPDPRIGALVHAALGDSRTVLNVGAGAGSYEPADRYVMAVEPSAGMRAQRPSDAVPAVNAVAEQLPFDADAFDGAMASVTIHQWPDAERGLRELRRVTRGPVVILTFDGDALDDFWLSEYAPELMAAERKRYPDIGWTGRVLGGVVDVITVPIPLDCSDGFTEAFYGRPEKFLEDAVRAGQSAWGFVADDAERRAVEVLARDLRTGAWDSTYASLRSQPTYLGSLRLIVARPNP